MTRIEHLEWSKTRALQYIDANNVNGAWDSMVSDLGKHPETANHIGLILGMNQVMMGLLSTPREMKKFIKGFN